MALLYLPDNHARTTTAQIQLEPPLKALVQELREVNGRNSRRCYALVDNADYRCEAFFKPRVQKIEEAIQKVSDSEPPLGERLAKKLADILLCDDHRKKEEHFKPLVLALSPTRKSDSKQSQDDSYLRKDSLQPLHSEMARRQRSKSAEPDLEPSHMVPKLPEPMRFHDANTQLEALGPTFQCIAFDRTAGPCTSRVDQRRLEWVRDFLQEEQSSPLLISKLRPVIHSLLCNDHSHWFWLDHYHDLWEMEIDCDEEIYPSIEDGSSSEPDSSDEEEVSDSGRGRTNGPSITINEPPSTPPQPASFMDYFSQVPASALRLIPRARVPASEPPPRRPAASADRNGSQRTASHHKTKPAISISRAPSPVSPSPDSAPPIAQFAPRRSPRTSSMQQSSSSAPNAADNLAAGIGQLDLNAPSNPPKPKPRRPAKKTYTGVLTNAAETLRNRLVRDLEADLANLLVSKLTKVDRMRHLYIFTTPALPGLVKIGKADRPEERGAMIVSKCKLPDLRVVHVEEDVRFASRAENLIHRHLAPLREDWFCEHEDKWHREWFRCEVDFAEEVVSAWADWMEGKPYGDGGLNDDWRARVKHKLARSKGFDWDETFLDMFERHRRWMGQL